MKIILELASFLNHVAELLSEHSDFHYNPNKLRYILGGAHTESPHQSYQDTKNEWLRPFESFFPLSYETLKISFSDFTGVIKEWKWNNRLQQIRFISKLSI